MTDASENAEAALRTLYRRVVDLERTAAELEAQLRVARASRAELERRCDQLEAEIEGLTSEAALGAAAASELEALRATRLLRWSRGPRAVYRRLRRSHPFGL